jgi:pentatricopeptide repeat protein
MQRTFGKYLLDTDRRELWCGAEPVAIEPQVFDLIAYLVEHRDRVVTKDELLQAVWGGRIVSDSALTTRINAARRAVGDTGETQGLIRTLPRKGVRFVGEVQEHALAPKSVLPPAPSAFCERPSIAVLPFQNMSGDPEHDYFADGMVEEITTALARIRWLVVIARNSSFTYKGQAIDIRQVGRELGVRYLLEGSVRKSGNQVRITAQLIEAETMAHLWAEHFDGSLEQVFVLQDQVASSVAGVIEPALQAAEAQRATRQPTKDLGAYDNYLRAHAMMLSPARRFAELEELFEEIFERDRDFGPALALAATFHMNSDIFGWCDDQDANRRNGLHRGRRALALAADDPAIIANAAFALGYFGEDINSMVALVDRALSLNPSFARGWHASAWLRLWAGQPDLAIEHFEASLRLSPRTRVGWSLYGVASAHMACRRFEEAIPKLLVAIQEDASANGYQLLVACYAHLGMLDKARETLSRMRSLQFGMSLPKNRLPALMPELVEAIVLGLRLATEEPT